MSERLSNALKFAAARVPETVLRVQRDEDFVEQLRAAFTCDPLTGEVFHTDTGKRRDTNGKPYRQIFFNGQSLLAHRVIWTLVHGEWPDATIDHIDGNPQNNAVSNLRCASARENSYNRGENTGKPLPEGRNCLWANWKVDSK